MSESKKPKKPATPEEQRKQEIRNTVAEMFSTDTGSMSLSIEAVGPFAPPPRPPAEHKSRLKRRGRE